MAVPLAPEKEDWLAFCRKQRPDLDDEAFERLKPQFLNLLRKMRYEARIGRRH